MTTFVVTTHGDYIKETNTTHFCTVISLLLQNQSEGGSVSTKPRLFLVVDLFAVKFKINLTKKDHSYSVLTMG